MDAQQGQAGIDSTGQAGPDQPPNDARELLRRRQSVSPSWLVHYYDEPLEIVGGAGNRVFGGDGRTYLDLFAGILTNMVGYARPEVRAAVVEQIDRGVVHTSTLYLVRKQVELAEKVAALSGIPDARVFFTNSGTEANEAALLLATAHRRSSQVIALRNSYHGRTFSTMAVTGNRGWSPSSLSPLQVVYAYGGYQLRSPFRHLDEKAYVEACAEDLRDLLSTTTAGDVACLIAEPIQGVGGFATPPDGFFKAYKEILDETGILFVSDEVQTGWGRTGEHLWGIQAHDVVPDLMTFAKGVAGGYALGGVVGRADVMDSLQANSISTFGGNPVAAAAGSAVLDLVTSLDLQSNAARVGAILLEGLRSLAPLVPSIAEVRGKGLMIGVELVVPGSLTPDPAAAARVQEQARRDGVLIGKGGLHGNCLRIGPPLTLTEDEAREGLQVLTASLRTLGVS
ncbi:MAG: aspartate aminotransferase family protein [Actinomycetales bacterium]